jgi:purine-binding chemotaxis protein CheW
VSTAYCTFQLADLFLGVEVTRVQEVIRAQETTNVPLVTPVVNGLINLRGEIVTTVDLRRRLDLEPWPADHEPMNVVIRTDDGIVSLLVDAIDDVLEVGDEGFEAPPATLRSPARDLLTGVHKLDGRLLLVLDVDRMLDLPAAAGVRGGDA